MSKKNVAANEQQSKPTKPRSGCLVWAKSGWRAKVTLTLDGETVRKVYKLGTLDRQVAEKKLARLLDEANPPPDPATVAAAALTFKEAADMAHEQWKAEGLGEADGRRDRLDLHAMAQLGPMPVAELRGTHVRNVLEAARRKGLSRGSIVHVKNAIAAVLDPLWRSELLAENVVRRVKTPKSHVDKRERATLTDDELGRYLAWTHPHEGYREGVLQRQTMAAVSRCFGGLRTGDLHAITWEQLDVEGGFRFGTAPREKTDTPQLLEIPAMLRPVLHDWWQAHGFQRSGLVFPCLRGERAGQQKGHVTHAKALRSDLRRCFGLEVWQGKGWTVARKPEQYTARERDLFTDTATSRRVDFHSFRRAFNTALADAGVNVQIAMRLAGHTNAATHMRYVMKGATMRIMPPAALPQLGAPKVPDQDDSPRGAEETPMIQSTPMNRRNSSAGSDSQKRSRSATSSELRTSVAPS
jgi:integrase